MCPPKRRGGIAKMDKFPSLAKIPVRFEIYYIKFQDIDYH